MAPEALPARLRTLILLALVGSCLLEGCGGEDAGSPSGDAGLGSTDAGEGGQASCEVEPRCLDIASIERCAPEGRVVESCSVGASCDDSEGPAACILAAACNEADTRCSDSRTLATCGSGEYQSQPCPGRCVDTPVGAECAPILAVQAYRGAVSYQVRGPNADLTDWELTARTKPARGFWVLAYHGEQLIDAVSTSETPGKEGTFELRLPAERSAEDSLVVMGAGTDARGQLAYAVADPGFGASDTLHDRAETPAGPRVWSWRFSSAQLSAGAKLTITEQDGSGAALIFQALHDVFRLGEQLYKPARSQTLLAWLGFGTSWQCGACYENVATKQFDTDFNHQLRFDGSADEGYWSEAVTRHELGHYIMTAYGVSPRETAPRYFGDPTNPGLAWLEGWATFFSSTERDSTIYFDKQLGGFFWFDIAARSYAFDGLAWQRPTAAAGLAQRIDENEVASLLWQSYRTLGDRAPLLAALNSERMRVGPFERGYTRRTWTDPDRPDAYVDTGVSVPYLADFFDALRCSNAVSPAQLDAITEPTLHYPYPSGSPLCR